jgi:UPF0755 protein
MTDPAVIYGLELEGRWRGAIYQSDLTRDTAYNTYLHTGLPPGPIANPGALRCAPPCIRRRRIISTLWPPAPIPRGILCLPAPLDEHNRNVAGYRHAVKKAGGR